MFPRASHSPKQLVIPMDVSFFIAENDPVRLLDETCNQLDYSGLMESLPQATRVSPSSRYPLCQVILYT